VGAGDSASLPQHQRFCRPWQNLCGPEPHSNSPHFTACNFTFDVALFRLPQHALFHYELKTPKALDY